MKDFFKYTLATVLGLIVAGIIFTVIGIASLAGMIASTSGSETVVKDNSIFVLDLSGTVEERYQSSPIDQLIGDRINTSGLDDILASIRKAKDNEKIKGIYLNAGALACSPASLEAIRNALLDFKESKKFIVAYGGAYTQSTYYLASVADKIAVNPSGSIGWHGLASQTMFLKDLLDKLGIEMQIFRVGTYKSAVEPFIGTEMSEANREQTQAFLNSIWGQIVNGVSVSRNIPADSLNSMADRNMDLQPAGIYVQTGLADTLMYKDQVLAYLKELTGCEEDDNLNTLDLEDMINVKRNVPKDKSGNIIAVYYAYGEIDGSTSSMNDEGINSEKVIKDLRKLREDENVKAVVFRVNSPGGSAYGSEQIWREVSLLKEKKPVVVSMGDYAASGGYYISCAADWIVAEPTTLTGSIGIFGYVPNTEKLVTGKLGLHFDVVKTNRLADMGDITRPFTEEEKTLMQNMVNKGYELFTKRCADGRNIPIDELKKIAEGRVWTGSMAKDLKLVDELGGIDKAMDEAVKRAGIENYTVVSYPEPGNFLTSLLETKADNYINGRLEENFGEYYEGFKFLKNLKDADRLQARMPFMLTIN
ncbi:signal peptide peptidase SppA [uncultured Bacteroides sp.]|jgi:protease-4|uniref:signal peptide peptidase SppA n=1 Tax=uncultured Bacteroides sp. TaxID=162156 RepID=UPI00280BC383|nr:signal peptide peptidase SppA [uncultured Bacteroides sp.]